jgi:hypothetical protein
MQILSFDDMQEHRCSIIKGALGATNHDYEISKAIAVKVGWGEIKDVMIRPGGLAAAMVINVSELSNLILVCIREGSGIRGSDIGNCKGVSQGGTVRSMQIVHGLPDSPHESRRAWWITLSCWRRNMDSNTWENASTWLPGLWVAGHDQMGGESWLGTLNVKWVTTQTPEVWLHAQCMSNIVGRTSCWNSFENSDYASRRYGN